MLEALKSTIALYSNSTNSMLSYKSGYLCKNTKVLDLYKKVEASIKYVEHNKKEIELAELKQEEVFAQMQKDYEAFWEDRTLEGTALEIAVGFTPIGIIQDVRDLTYYFTNWECSWKHVGLTGLAIVALIPGVSEVKKIIKGVNQGSDLVKNASKISRALDSGSLSKLKSLSADALEDIKKVGLEISDDIGDGLNRIFKNKGLEAAGIGPVAYFDDIGNIKKVDTSDISPLNDIQNNYNKIVNGGDGIKGGGKAEVGWDMSVGRGNINGRRYSQHAMERMAPNIPEDKAELYQRATKIAKEKGLAPQTKEYSIFIDKYVDPRNIPPSVIEDAIKNTKPIPGNGPSTFVHATDSVKVITNGNGDVITVIPK